MAVLKTPAMMAQTTPQSELMVNGGSDGSAFREDLYRRAQIPASVMQRWVHDSGMDATESWRAACFFESDTVQQYSNAYALGDRRSFIL
mmetsp:Transcript_9954/g.13125  ORF Transcript_9954/g.13125 Transcript_9954/m.13125 type:complete len:89 (-) Transcript_9954:75-341(-)